MGGGYTHSVPAPSPGRLFLCFLVLGALTFLRPPTTNFIYDEQEALLGNPYLQEGSSYLDAFVLDFWGRAPGRTIGSYRPLPNLLWWPLRGTLDWNTPWVLCLLNLFFHAGTATLLSLSAERAARRIACPERVAFALVWGMGLFFLLNASATEAVCSAVGLADLLVGFFAACQLFTLFLWMERGGKIGSAVAIGLCGGATFLGLLGKETTLASVVWVPLLALLWAPPDWGRGRVFRGAALMMAAGVLGLIGFVYLRANLFPSSFAKVSSFVRGDFGRGWLAVFFEWFRQPKMPVDPLNNPLLGASKSDQWATGFRLFLEQLTQLFFPWGQSADHSFPRTKVTSRGVAETTGALALLALFGITLEGLRRRWVCGTLSLAWLLSAGGAILLICTYLPVSNLLVLLPTVRGDRLLYSPTLGAALLLGGALLGLSERHAGAPLVLKRSLPALFLGYLGFQALVARAHAFDYRSDVAFWRATSQGNPASAKAHLNLGVMVGARGDERGRLGHTLTAVRLAPEWPMGQIYLGDVYCRLGELESAWPHYVEGFSALPNSKVLTALGLQCLWERGGFTRHRSALLDLATAHPDTWLDYFVTELAVNGEAHDGIPQKYRPRKYNARPALK